MEEDETSQTVDVSNHQTQRLSWTTQPQSNYQMTIALRETSDKTREVPPS